MVHLQHLHRLKRFSFYCGNELGTPISIANTINVLANGNVSIEDLTLQFVDLNLKAFKSLKKLNRIKRLTIILSKKINENLSKAISGLESLQYLCIKCGSCSPNYIYCSSIGPDLSDLIEIIRMAKRLSVIEYIEYDRCEYLLEWRLIIINEVDFKKLVQLIKDRGNGVALKIYFSNDIVQLKVPKYFIEENRK